jgi:hypothetical protein
MLGKDPINSFVGCSWTNRMQKTVVISFPCCSYALSKSLKHLRKNEITWSEKLNKFWTERTENHYTQLQWNCYCWQGCQYSSLQFPYSVPFAIWVWQNLDLQFRHTCQAVPAIWNGTCQVIAINPPAITNSKNVSSTELGKFFGACHSPVLAMHSKVVRYKESNHSLNFFRETQPVHYTINFIVPVFLYVRMNFYWYPLLSCIVLVGCEMQFCALL